MYGNLPQEQHKIRERFIGDWIASQATVDGQIGGCATIVSAFYDVLKRMIGEVAIRAVLIRASSLAKQKYPLLTDACAVQGGLDVDCLRAELGGEDPYSSREALAGLVDELFSVLYGLLGSTFMPVLREVEAELAAKGPAPPAD